jgi:hypothetical protein
LHYSLRRRIQHRRLFSSLLPQQDPQFRRPVRQREGQALQIRMASPDLKFRFRNFPAATLDSYGRVLPFFRDLIERSPVAVERGLLRRVLLPAPHDHVDVLGVEFHAKFVGNCLTGIAMIQAQLQDMGSR